MAKHFRRLLTVLAVLALMTGLLYWLVPALLAPAQDFPQGPGGAMAYSALIRQVREQYPAYWAGQDVHLVLTEPEFSGMVSSALLTGQRPDSPVRKVRASLGDGAIGIDTVLHFPQAPGPERFHGPFGLSLRLLPAVDADGIVRFHIQQAKVGRIPIPTQAIRLVGDRIPALNAGEATIDLPLGDLLSNSLGHRVRISGITAKPKQLRLTVSLVS